MDPAGDRLAIADSGHHRVVLADLDETIRTVAGAGQQAHGPVRPAAGGPLATSLNSPWDLVVLQGVLYIAAEPPRR